MVTPIILANPFDKAMPINLYAVYEHLGLGCLASVLRQKGFDVMIIDAHARGLKNHEVIETVREVNPRLLGLSATYRTLYEALEIARAVKASCEDVHITLGGEQATFAAEDILRSEPCVDSIVRGEGEETIVELATAVYNKKSLNGILGVFYEEGGVIHKNPDRPAIEDLDSLPFPCRDTLEYCVKEGKPAMIGLLASRGCYNNCTFCNARYFLRMGGGSLWRARSPKNIVDELEELDKKYGLKSFHDLVHFYDVGFLDRARKRKQWAKEVASEIMDRGLELSFAIYCRADCIDPANPEDLELIKLLKSAGLADAFIGLEAGSQSMLDVYKKNVTVQQNKQILRVFNDNRILTMTNGFIMFNPYTTMEDLRRNAEFLLDTEQATYWNFAQKVQLFPGVAMIEMLRKEGLLKPEYTHTDVYAYKFVDSRMEKLVNSLLDLCKNDILVRENSLVRYILMQTLLVEDLVVKNPHLKDDEMFLRSMREYEERILKCKKRIQKHNYLFFSQCVDLAEHGWKEKMFESYKSQFLRIMNGLLGSISEAFEEFVGFIDKSLDKRQKIPASVKSKIS